MVRSKEQIREYHRVWSEKNREKINKMARGYYKKDIQERRRRSNYFYQKNKERIKPINRKRKKENYKIMKGKIINHYAGNPPKCQCCGFNEGAIFLVIDHVNGGGTKERKKTCAEQIYRKIIKNNFPNDYEVICANCNQAKRINNGVCFHKQK